MEECNKSNSLNGEYIDLYNGNYQEQNTFNSENVYSHIEEDKKEGNK